MKKKISIVMLIILIVSALTFGLVSCKPEEPEPEPEKEPTTSEVITQIIEKMDKAFAFSSGKAVGWENVIDISYGESFYTLKTSGRLDPTDKRNTKIKLSVLDEDKEVFMLGADDEFMFVETETAKHRFTGLNLGEMITKEALSADNKTITGLISAVFTLVFEECETSKTRLSLVNGSLAGVVDALKEMIGSNAILDEVFNLLAGLKFELNCKLDKNGNFEKLDLTVLVGENEAGLAVNKGAKLGNDVKPEIALPAKDDKEFAETQLVNFSIDGTFSLVNKDDAYNRTNIADYNYKLFVDFNPFDIIKSGLGKDEKGNIVFNVEKALFTSETTRIYFDISHICTDACKDFCATKLTQSSKGSILTIAYDKTSNQANFNNDNLYIALNAKQILPKSVMDSLVGAGTTDMVAGLLPEFMGININPTALLAMLTRKATVMPTAETKAAANLQFNPLQLVTSILKLVDGIRYDGAISLETEDIYDIVDIFGPMAGQNIVPIIKALFGEQTEEIKVNANFKYADTSYDNFNIFQNFTYIDKNVAELKDFGGLVGTTEWDKDAKGNIKINSGGSVVNYDENGNPLPVSQAELATILTSGNLSYTYTDVYGKAGTGNARISKVYGLDWTKVGVEQEIELLVENTSGKLNELLIMIKAFLGIDVLIPGELVKVKVIISEVEDKTWAYNADVAEEMKLNPEKEYKYDDKLYLAQDLTITYKDNGKYGAYSKVIKTIQPNETDVLYNYNDATSATIQAITDTTFNWGYSEFTKSELVKVADYKITDNTVEKTVSVNEWLRLDKSLKVKYALGEEAAKQATVKVVEGLTNQSLEGIENLEYQAYLEINWLGQLEFKTYDVKFAKAGKYTLAVQYSMGQIITYNITVTEAVRVPGYAMSGDMDKNYVMNFDITRTEQGGEDLAVVPNLVATDILTKAETTLKLGTDYQVGVMENGEFKALEQVTLQSYLPQAQKLAVKVLNETYKKANFDFKFELNMVVGDMSYNVVNTTINNKLKDAYSRIQLDYNVYEKDYVGAGTEVVGKKVGLFLKPTLKGEAFEGIKNIDFKIEIKLGDGEYQTLDYTLGYLENSQYKDFAEGDKLAYTADGNTLQGKTAYILFDKSIVASSENNFTIRVTATTPDYDNMELCVAEKKYTSVY